MSWNSEHTKSSHYTSCYQQNTQIQRTLEHMGRVCIQPWTAQLKNIWHFSWEVQENLQTNQTEMRADHSPVQGFYYRPRDMVKGQRLADAPSCGILLQLSLWMSRGWHISETVPKGNPHDLNPRKEKTQITRDLGIFFPQKTVAKSRLWTIYTQHPDMCWAQLPKSWNFEVKSKKVMGDLRELLNHQRKGKLILIPW